MNLATDQTPVTGAPPRGAEEQSERPNQYLQNLEKVPFKERKAYSHARKRPPRAEEVSSAPPEREKPMHSPMDLTPNVLSRKKSVANRTASMENVSKSSMPTEKSVLNTTASVENTSL